MSYPDNLRYTKEHEWIEPTSGKIGITQFAQEQLGDVVFLDFEVENGEQVDANQRLGSIESVKTVSDIYSPVRGKIVALNTTVGDKPELVNQDPYGEGWLLQLEDTEKAEITSLMDAKAYIEQITE